MAKLKILLRTSGINATISTNNIKPVFAGFNVICGDGVSKQAELCCLTTSELGVRKCIDTFARPFEKFKFPKSVQLL